MRALQDADKIHGKGHGLRKGADPLHPVNVYARAKGLDPVQCFTCVAPSPHPLPYRA